MALSKDERINISEKIVAIPLEDANSDEIVATIAAGIEDATAKDDTNKGLMNKSLSLITGYQDELDSIDGNLRTDLVEQDVIDSAKKILENPFFPNNSQNPLPNVPDGVWKNFQAFSKNKAIGKNYNETYGSVSQEKSTIVSLLADITTAEAATDITRVTGEDCTVGAGMDPDVVAANAAIQALMTTVKALAVTLRATLTSQAAAYLSTEPDTGKQAENDSALNDINNVIIPAIDAWEAFVDFDPQGGIDCPIFDGTDINTLLDTKFKPTQLTAFKAALTTRQAFSTTREAQLNVNLGSITQAADGAITATTGLYGERYRFIEMRINLIGGTLSKIYGLQNAIDAQGQAKLSNENVALAYDSIIKASLFTAASNGSNKLNIADASNFAAGDVVYISAKGKSEIQTSIKSIDGTRVTLAKDIPVGYKPEAGGRIYKDIS